jgi:hypothetical protein
VAGAWIQLWKRYWRVSDVRAVRVTGPLPSAHGLLTPFCVGAERPSPPPANVSNLRLTRSVHAPTPEVYDATAQACYRDGDAMNKRNTKCRKVNSAPACKAINNNTIVSGRQRLPACLGRALSREGEREVVGARPVLHSAAGSCGGRVACVIASFYIRTDLQARSASPKAPALSRCAAPPPPRALQYGGVWEVISTFTATKDQKPTHCKGPGLMAECMSGPCYRQQAWDGSPVKCYCLVTNVGASGRWGSAGSKAPGGSQRTFVLVQARPSLTPWFCLPPHSRNS